MFGKGRVVSVPGKLVEEDSLFKACDAERLGQKKRKERQPQHHSENAAQLLSLALGSALGVLC